ncbi:MAG TPA: TonB-dependent receptor plug domain-containing protein [Opitutaceae bacterium]|nr:TonB-dependent receptor plug domain-containing protein [Opitutaceae bacterium]
MLTSLHAQTTPAEDTAGKQKTKTPASTAPQKLPSSDEVRSAAERKERETVELSPFEVTAEKDRGYYGGRSMSGTRLNTDLENIAASISVVTKQQLIDTAAVDLNDIFAYEVSTEGTRNFTANINDGKGDVDSVSLNPESSNRIRGIGQSNLAIGNFAASSSIPVDTYNIDAIEISRGPNSSIFGVGEASGTVNLVPAAANTNRDITRTTLMATDRGSLRGTLDINRVLLKDRFALRLNAVADDKEYRQKPSYDKTRRIQIGTTYQPFSKTTVRASFEKFKEKYDRPNSATPAELMTFWEQNGRPSYDPSTNTYSYTNAAGVKVTGVQNPSGSGTTAFPAGVMLSGLGSTRVRPSMWIDQGEVQWFGSSFYNDGRNHEIVQVSVPTNYNVPAPYVGTLSYTGIYNTTDKSLYDYDHINLAGLNFGKKSAELSRIEIEQFFYESARQVLAAQFGFFQENITDLSRNFVGLGGDGVPSRILPDVMTNLPDGSPNPYYGHPYITALSPQTYSRPVDSKTYRLNLAYQLDLTQEKNWFRFLGKQRVVGYAERYDKVFAPKALRYQDQISDSYPWLLPSIRNSNSAKYSARYYLGDGQGNNVDYATSAPDLSSNVAFHRFGNTTDNLTNRWITESVPIDTTYFANTLQQVRTHTEGFVLQSYFLQDRVVATWGRRKDTLRTRDNVTPEPATAIDPNGLSTDLGWMNDFDDDPYLITNKLTGTTKSVGYTQTRGIVVKPLSWLQLRYSDSNSLKPESFAIDFQGNPLSNPHGETRDYGFRLYPFDGKLIIGLSHFHTFSNGSRKSDATTVAARITNFDFDRNPESDGSKVDLEDWLTDQLLLKDFGPTGNVNVPDQVYQQYLQKAHELMGMTQERIDALRNYDAVLTVDVESKGYELEVAFNPSKYWTLKFNGTQTETVVSSIGPSWQAYRDERMPVWKAMKSPLTGETYWDHLFSGNNVPQTIWQQQNEAPMKLQLALQGKSQPQVRKYRFNMLTSYNLAGISSNRFLKSTTLGGSLRWEDRGSIGYQGGEPDADGLIREYDANRPIMDSTHLYVDFFARYGFSFWKNRVRSSVQLNVRNAFEGGRLQAFRANPDGSEYAFRIIEPREFVLSVSFDL